MACDPHYTRTALLLHCNGANGSTTFTDETGKTVSVVGNAVISTAQSKFGGASAYFDGTGDYISVPYSSDFDFAAQDFTIEFWIYKVANNANTSRIWSAGGDYYHQVGIDISASGNLSVYMTSNGTTWNLVSAVSVAAIANATWTHVAVVRNGGTAKAFVGGVGYTLSSSLGTTALANGTGASSIRSIGGQAGTNRSLNGYIDDFRVTLGLARYSSDFTPPSEALPGHQCAISGVVGQVGAPLERLVRLYRRDTGTLVGQTLSSPSTGAYSIQTSVEGEHFALVHDTANGDPFFQNVSLLLPMDGSTASTSFADLSPNKKVVTSAGGAQISTAQSKFCGSSALFDGVDDFLTVPANTDLDFGSGDFTIELFVMFASVPTGGNYAALVTRRDSGTTNISYNLWYGGTEKFYFSFSANGTTQINSATLNTTTPAPNQWYHIALVRSGTNVDIYVDGTKGTAHNIGTSALFTSTSVLRIGAANSTPTFFLNGYIDDLRITKGVARYTANFTPPTAPYPSGAIGGDLNAVIYDRLIPA